MFVHRRFGRITTSAVLCVALPIADAACRSDAGDEVESADDRSDVTSLSDTLADAEVDRLGTLSLILGADAPQDESAIVVAKEGWAV